MNTLDRRRFLGQSAGVGLGVAAGLTILADPRAAAGAPAHDRIHLALIGAGGRGSNLARDFAARGDCEFAWLCDCNAPRTAALVDDITKLQQGRAPQTATDFRKILDDPNLDAVVIATPDHWHALATILACQAGKDVYVEKPPTHNAWEGQQMVAAARKHARIVQVGTQNRSAHCYRQAREYISSGKLGKIHFCRIYNQKEWPNFPPQPITAPPAGLDWDLFNGPAPESGYSVNFQTQWHHFWRYSSGDIVNDGIHQIDLARYLLGVELPRQVYCTGRRFEPGAAETPDTQVAVWDFGDMVVTLELTLNTPYMLKIAPGIRQSLTEFPYWPQCATRIEIYGSEGLMYVGRHGGGWQVFSRPVREQPVMVAQGNGKFPDPEHKDNFLACVRSRETPNAPIEQGHLSVLWAHYATISYRLGGEKLVIDPASQHVVGNERAMACFRREYRAPYVIPDVV